STWHQAYTNSGFSPAPSSPEHLCRACGGQVDSASRNVCVDCKKHFCSRCWVEPELRPALCQTCRRFLGTRFERSQLMGLKVKELRDYLHLHDIPTHMCREKEELVELVLDQNTPSSSSNSRSSSSSSNGCSNSAPPPAASDVPQSHTPLSQAAEEPGSLTEEDEEEEEEEEGEDEDEDDDDDDDDEVKAFAEHQAAFIVLLSIKRFTVVYKVDSRETLVHSRRASLSDLRSVEDVEGLTVRQLKEILARNFVNFQGCCEKWELMERVTRLFNDQKDLHNLVAEPAEPSGQEENLCKICMDSPIDCVLLECGHMVTCSKCGKRMSECPICRQYVVRAVHVFRS
ncbi:E3 ubiquitin-protein ligase rififylin isoform X1, partial [Silurus asotus]